VVSPILVEATDNVVVTDVGTMVVVGVDAAPSVEVLVSGLEMRVLVVWIGVVVCRGEVVAVSLGVVEGVVGVVERTGEELGVVLATETGVEVGVDEGKVVADTV
jgi:hypothetical protein